MRLLIVGAGGTGGYFGARWAEAGHAVTLLARGPHLDAIRTSGLTVHSPAGDVRSTVHATDDAREVGEVDLVVFATKSWQLPQAIADVAPHVLGRPAVIGVQNGVDSVATLAATFPPSDVLGATCRIISFIDAPGVIRHVGVEPTLLLGETEGGRSDRVARLQAELDLGEPLRVRASDDVQLDIWKKFLFFAPVSGVGSVTRSPIGVFRSVPESRRLLESALAEVFEVARARGIALADGSVARALAFIDTIPADGTSSMQRDVEAGRRTELDALAGAVVRMGREVGVATPAHEFICAALRPLEAKARGEVAWESSA